MAAFTLNPKDYQLFAATAALPPQQRGGPSPFNIGFKVASGPLKGYLYETQIAACFRDAIASLTLPPELTALVVPPPAGAGSATPDIVVRGVVRHQGTLRKAAAGALLRALPAVAPVAPVAPAAAAGGQLAVVAQPPLLGQTEVFLAPIEVKVSAGADFGQVAAVLVLFSTKTSAYTKERRQGRWWPADGSATFRENPQWVHVIFALLRGDPRGLARWRANNIRRVLEAEGMRADGSVPNVGSLQWVGGGGGVYHLKGSQLTDKFFLSIKLKNDEVLLTGTTGCSLPSGILWSQLDTWMRQLQDNIWEGWWQEILNKLSVRRQKARAANSIVDSGTAKALTKLMWKANKEAASLNWADEVKQRRTKLHNQGKSSTKLAVEKELAQAFQIDALNKGCALTAGAAAASRAGELLFGQGCPGTCPRQSEVSKRGLAALFSQANQADPFAAAAAAADAPPGTPAPSLEIHLPVSKKIVAPYYLMKGVKWLQMGEPDGSAGLYSMGSPYTFSVGHQRYAIPSFFDSIVKSAETPYIRGRLKPTDSFFSSHDIKPAVRLRVDRTAAAAAAGASRAAAAAALVGVTLVGVAGVEQRAADGAAPFHGAQLLNLNFPVHRMAFLQHLVDLAQHGLVIATIPVNLTAAGGGYGGGGRRKRSRRYRTKHKRRRKRKKTRRRRRRRASRKTRRKKY